MPPLGRRRRRGCRLLGLSVALLQPTAAPKLPHARSARAAALLRRLLRRLQVPVLKELEHNYPSEEELEALGAYLDGGGDPRQLGKAEQLFAALRRTARLRQKLRVLQFKDGLADAAGEAAAPLARIAAALDQVRASGQLRLLLHTALCVANTLNAGRKAPQRGIRLASLRCAAAGRGRPGRHTSRLHGPSGIAECAAGGASPGAPPAHLLPRLPRLPLLAGSWRTRAAWTAAPP